MAEAVRRLKINRRYASVGCPWCGDMLALGEDGAVCEACESPHHARCWDKENGCGQTNCINAPLQQDVNAIDLEEQLASNETRCPHCHKVLPAGTIKCSSCLRFTTLSGLYEGVRKTSDEARDAFLLGIVALVVPPILNLVAYSGGYKFGVFSWLPLVITVRCGWSAIKKGKTAKNQIASDQTLKGAGLALAAQILGWIALALPVLGTGLLIAAISTGNL